jgi:hypothetical protein
MMSKGQTSLLVRTPAQHADESTWGYILRLTSCNGYHRPTALFSLAGMSSVDYQGIKVNCHKLKAVLGENGSELRPYMSSHDGTVTLLNGGVLWPTDLTVGAGRVCVQCVNKLGYLPAWTDLRLIDACPKHKKFLLTDCSACGTKLNWKRPAILQCSCGETFKEEDCAPASDEHCALIEVMVSLVEGSRVEPNATYWKAFPSLTLSRLLGLCRGMASLHSRIFRDEHLSDSQRAARMLQDWPRNLYRMIDVLADGHQVEALQGGMILRRLASTCYNQLLRAVSGPSDVAALLAVLANYVPGDATLAKRHLTIPPSLNVHARVRNKAERSRVSSPKRERPKAPHHGTLSLLMAAARLGMPVTLLKYLRKNGHFEVRQAATWSSAFSVEDIARFESKVVDLPLEPVDGATATVRELLLRSLRGDGKGILAAAILDGRIRAVARTGPLFSDLVLLAEEAETVRRSLKRDTYGGTLSCAEAGALIGVNPTALASLCRMGLVRSYQCVIGFRVYPGAAEEFAANYVGLKEVATEGGSGPIWAIVAAEEVGVELFRDAARPTRHVFIRRADMSKVVNRLRQTRRGAKKPKGSGSMWKRRKEAREAQAS